MKYPYERLLLPGEAIAGEPMEIAGEDCNFSTIPVSSPGYRENDVVLLDIATNSSKNVLIGGNPLHIETLRGFGRLVIQDLKEDSRISIYHLNPRVKVTVPADNILYWYENVLPNHPGGERLIIRDYCDGFSPLHEPVLEDVVAVMNKMMLGASCGG